MLTVQGIVTTLNKFWEEQGCILHHGHDVETGAGTFNPATFFRCLGPEPYRAAYVEPSRRPKDGRYGQNPNRMQFFHQYQVIIKPSPPNIQQLYLQSLEAIGFRLKEHDIRFVHDDWEQPSLGAWGLGWEVWRDGMEMTQFTYFQAVGGVELRPVTVEIAIGLERLAMTVQGVDNVFDLKWDDRVTYGDIFHENDVEWSTYNFEKADTNLWHRHFTGYAQEARHLLECNLPIPAYDFVMKASHAFNLLDARGVISATERPTYINEIRTLAKGCAEGYLAVRERLNYPLLHRNWPEPPPLAPPPVEPPLPPLHRNEDLLLEIGSEELPATFIPIGITCLKSKLTELLKSERLIFDEIRVVGTPRRLAAYVTALHPTQSEEQIERRGPPLTTAFDSSGHPTAAGTGFFRSINLPQLTLSEIQSGDAPSVTIRSLKGVDYLFALLTTPTATADQILKAHLPALILSLDFPKSMRWGNQEITYARPLRWIVALHGDRIIPLTVGQIRSGNLSYAHPQICPGWFTLPKASDYFSLLHDHNVMVDPKERERSILAQQEEIARELQCTALCPPSLLAEVVNLVEWPLLTTATFDPKYLAIPKEVAISEMIHHQRYLPLLKKDGTLTNRFAIVADNFPTDEVRRGNTKVLSARLADGAFLYAQDLKLPLEEFNEKLKKITFLRDLGTLHDKAMRLLSTIRALHPLLPACPLEIAERAALLSKADLATELVGEFPELQGVIGHHYALKQGESDAIAIAIDEHWMPRGEKGPLPQTPAGTLLSLADKFDNLISAFALNLKPTSSSDPYALRRQTLAIARILLASHIHLPLRETLTLCYDRFLAATNLLRHETLIDELVAFFRNRIKTVFLDEGFAKEEIEASLSASFTGIYDAELRLRALHLFRKDPCFPSLTEVFRRARGQLGELTPPPFNQNLLQEPAEIALLQALVTAETPFVHALENRNYPLAYALLANLQLPLASLFDHVKILADDPAIRNNRLALLQRVLKLFSELLDFSQLRL